MTTRRNPLSDMLAREAFRLLSVNYLRVLSHPHDRVREGGHARSARTGRHRHRALDARCRPCVREPPDGALRHRAWRGHRLAPAACGAVERCPAWPIDTPSCAESAGLPRRPEALAGRLEQLIAAAGFPDGLATAGVGESDLPALAVEAASSGPAASIRARSMKRARWNLRSGVLIAARLKAGTTTRKRGLTMNRILAIGACMLVAGSVIAQEPRTARPPAIAAAPATRGRSSVARPALTGVSASCACPPP